MANIRMKKNYRKYCEEKKELGEGPLPYVGWLELELQAWMEWDEERENTKPVYIKSIKEKEPTWDKNYHDYMMNDC